MRAEEPNTLTVHRLWHGAYMATVDEAPRLAGRMAGAILWILDGLMVACMFLLPFTVQCVNKVFIAKIYQ